LPRILRAEFSTSQGKPIDGLFACGNDATSVMRGIYPGAGITIGPGMVFAYRAMKAIRKKQA
jgi:3-oxosteroid 1-dehydrogenase